MWFLLVIALEFGSIYGGWIAGRELRVIATPTPIILPAGYQLVSETDMPGQPLELLIGTPVNTIPAQDLRVAYDAVKNIHRIVHVRLCETAPKEANLGNLAANCVFDIYFNLPSENPNPPVASPAINLR